MLAAHSIDREVWREAGKQGLFGLDIPSSAAWADDYRFNAISAEELSKFNAAVSPASASTPTFARPISSTRHRRAEAALAARHGVR